MKSAKFFRMAHNVPKCHSCFSGGRAMPGSTPGGTGNIPIGLDGNELVPCGCDAGHARTEQYFVGVGVINGRQANGRLIVRIQPRYRRGLANSYRLFLQTTASTSTRLSLGYYQVGIRRCSFRSSAVFRLLIRISNRTVQTIYSPVGQPVPRPRS